MADKDVIVVDFVGKNGEKVYAWRQSTQERIRLVKSIPDSRFFPRGFQSRIASLMTPNRYTPVQGWRRTAGRDDAPPPIASVRRVPQVLPAGG